MGEMEGGADLAHSARGLAQIEGAARHPVLEGPGLQVRHHQIGMSVFLSVVLHRNNIRVPKLKEDGRLAPETGAKVLLLGHLRGKDFQGDIALLFQVEGAVHRGHTPLADLLEDVVAAQGAPDQ